MCSTGMKYRQVVCRDGDETLPNTYCDDMTKPLETQGCHVWNSTICVHIRPPSLMQSSSTYMWEMKPFSEVRMPFDLILHSFALGIFSAVQRVERVVEHGKFIV